MEIGKFRRINGETLPKYHGCMVGLVGKVKSQEGQTAMVEAADGKDITIMTQTGSNYTPGSFVEVVGKCIENGNAIEEQKFCDFGTDFDLSSYNQLCALADGKMEKLFF
jgi:myo-inositol-hexaphosphate 3-phosphohydrolase